MATCGEASLVVPIEHKSRNPEVSPIRSKVLDILAAPRPFYNLVSITRPTDSNKANESDDIRKLKLCVKIFHSVQKSTMLGIENKNTILEIFTFKNKNQKILPFQRRHKTKSIRAERIKPSSIIPQKHRSTNCKRIGLQII